MEHCMDIKAYLERIHYQKALVPAFESVRDLELSHLLSVPFENLSIHANEPILLQEDALFDKIVQRRRGGFCYELNGLFAALLRQLGFEVTLLSAGVANTTGGFGPDFDHMTLMVQLEKRWLVDVGFGDSFREPLWIDNRDVQVQGLHSYQLIEDGDSLMLKARAGERDWKSLYRFTLRPRELADYEEMCQYHQRSPQSHFTQKRVCTMAKKDGRATLSDTRLIETLGAERRERVLASEEEYEAILAEMFGIVMGGGEKNRAKGIKNGRSIISCQQCVSNFYERSSPAGASVGSYGSRIGWRKRARQKDGGLGVFGCAGSVTSGKRDSVSCSGGKAIGRLARRNYKRHISWIACGRS
jgi:N-hydroxyarylamine O-acetyltransferase